MFKTYTCVETFIDTLEGHLAKWLDGNASNHSSELSTASSAGLGLPSAEPAYGYWLAEGERLLSIEPDVPATLYCAVKAVDAAENDIEWAAARRIWGVAQFRLGRYDQSMTAFVEIEQKFVNSVLPDHQSLRARALFNKGVVFEALDRSEEAIAVYDELVKHFGASSSAALGELVAAALFNKGGMLKLLDRREEAIAAYDHLVAHFGVSSDAVLRESVAKALFNKGIVLAALGRCAEAIAVWGDVVARFGASSDAVLRSIVGDAKSLMAT